MTSPEVERAVFGCVGAHLQRSCCSCVFAGGASSGLGGARTLLFGSSDRRYTVSATSPSACKMLGIDTKKPGVTLEVTSGSPTLLRQFGLVLPASGMPQLKIAREHIRALLRGLFPATLITFGTQPYGSHDSVFQLLNAHQIPCPTHSACRVSRIKTSPQGAGSQENQKSWAKSPRLNRPGYGNVLNHRYRIFA